MEDKKIAELFKLRDEKAVEELSRQYGKLFRNLAFKILNNSGFKNNSQPIKFICETEQYKKKLSSIKQTVLKFWEQLEIYPADENGNKLFSAEKVECWEASNNGSLFGQGVNLITDVHAAAGEEENTFMGTRFVFSDYEPRWPDVEIEGPDGEPTTYGISNQLKNLI